MSRSVSQVNTVEKNKIINLEKQQVIDPIGEYNPDDLIFALDIGTRTVIGILGVQKGDMFNVLAAEVVEHRNRAMLDGQIHDISQVAEIAKEVKEKIEIKTGISITKVAIAAAGRVLKTCKVKVERDIEHGKEIEQDIINSLEIEGIQEAQLRLDDEISLDEKSQFYCVGYTVIDYYLNGFVISSLLGHKGKKIAVDVLATFLPHIVVDSLYTVMRKIGLEVVSLTLEPIAAINATIPKDLRLLNLALVDIGAGTSDIAITKDGSVVAYAMAPIAGDEVTEAISHYYLVDFKTAEYIKKQISSAKDIIGFIDILGKKHEVKSSEVVDVIKPVVELLAKTISEKIIEYNGHATNAVFLIGGGSQSPGLAGMVSAELKLHKDRVVVRGRDVVQNVNYSGEGFDGPDTITPLGIALTAQTQKGQDFLSVIVDGRKVRLFNSKKLNVADALILTGYNANQLIGRTGKSVSFYLNGEKKVVRGGYGKAAEIFVNGKISSMETEINSEDEISVIPAENGENAIVRVTDYVKHKKVCRVSFNGSEMILNSSIFINGKSSGIESNIYDGDNVMINEISSVKDFIKLCEIDTDKFLITVNGNEVDDNYSLEDFDVILTNIKNQKLYQVDEPIDLNFEDKQTEYLESNDIKNDLVDDSGEKLENILFGNNSSFSVVVNGKAVEMGEEKQRYIFVDIFNYIDFDLKNPQGSIVLKLNGEKAGYTEKLEHGDVIDIYWE